MTLIEFLNRNGYRRIPLTRSGVGHFHTDGFLNDRPVSILVDTGASSTVFSFDVARELNLALTKSTMSGGGAGAARLDVHHIRDARFLVGDFSPTAGELMTMDLSHVNTALALRGSARIDAILGADVLEAHRAVIDYGSSSLYLKM